MQVEVIYAKPDEVFREQLELEEQASVQTALEVTALWQRYPELDPQTVKYGIYGKLVGGDTLLKNQDRIEIYRPLRAKGKKQKLDSAGG